MTENMKIVIAYDGSDCANAALDDLKHAGLPAVAQAVVISVAEMSDSRASGFLIAREVSSKLTAAGLNVACAGVSPVPEETQALTLKAVNSIREIFPFWDVSAETDFGSPAERILARAATLEADLIIVGSHGRSALGRLLLGSASQKIVTEAHCSVRIARASVEEGDHPARIVIGVDGSTSAEPAVRAVASRTWPPGSKALLIAAREPIVPTTVGQLIPPAVKVAEEFDKKECEWLNNMLAAQASLLREARLDVSLRIKTGDPSQVLLEEAEEWRADSIFVGARGLSRIKRFLIGSVSASVAARAHCSVEVVR